MTLLFCFLTAALVHLGAWLLLGAGIRRISSRPPGLCPPDTRPGMLPPVSVVVAARDEARRLPALLHALCRQTHPDYEVVVVDDASEDESAAIVEGWAAREPRVRLLRIREPVAPRKKHALTAGIEAARYELLALTDADCIPPPTWLAALAEHHGDGREERLLVGYSPFRRGPGLLNRLARYETFVTGVLTAGAAQLGLPYMAVGRNLSYPRSVFRRVGGFAHALQSLSGDDDLFVQEVARRRAAVIRPVLDPRTFVDTDAPPTWRAWIHQKLRHGSAGRYYGRRVQLHLALFQGTGLLLWLAPLALGWTGAALLALKLVVQHLVLREVAPRFGEEALVPSQPALELLYAVYLLLLAPVGVVRAPRRW